MPLLETKGAASAQGFGLTIGGAQPVYIEDVFSTYLYTGNGSTQTITNGIDLSGKGGLTWFGSRNAYVGIQHYIIDSARGIGKTLYSYSTDAQGSFFNGVNSYNSNGVTLNSGDVNASGNNGVLWTFRKQPKFFDVVTFTGNGSLQTISHSLNSLPGCLIYKRINSTSDWYVVTRKSATEYVGLKLNTTGSLNFTGTPAALGLTSTTFDPGYSFGTVSGGTYVAYLFAHDAGGFGLSGSDNVISCGSFTTDGSGNATVNLGYEPQWILTKTSSVANDWELQDSMRGLSYSNNGHLQPNTSNAENAAYVGYTATATGFNAVSRVTSATYIYIAIRRGPMKVPTSGTSVYENSLYTGNGGAVNINSSIIPDAWWDLQRTSPASPNFKLSAARLMGSPYIYMYQTAGQQGSNVSWSNAQFTVSVNDTAYIDNGGTYVSNIFRRAPGFFDVVCYNRASGATVTHNLGVTPELLIVKRRGGAEAWGVMRPNTTGYLLLNTTDALSTGLSATATSTTFTLGTGAFDYSDTYVAYLFATCPGVSKVGSYTGTGTTQQINCGFTGGARFVLIKRTDSTGDWYVWDTARGIVSGNDPYLLLNSTAAEVTSTDYIDPVSTGFEISSTAPAAINANGGTFIYLAIA